MINNVISVGDKLDLLKLKIKDNEVVNDKIYTSQLLDYIDNDKANISMPIVKGRIIPLTVGDRYILCFYTTKGLFQCKAIITDRFKNNNIYIHEIQFLSELEKYQRRQYFRLDCIIDITYHVITNIEILLANQVRINNFQNEIEKNECIDALESYRKICNKGTIIDISGGGARFNSNLILDLADSIQINVELGTSEGIKTLVLDANVISSNKMMHRPGYFEHRIQFKEILQDDREAIIKFIFEVDRRKRRKEKGIE